jgi:hypothetical protein
MKPPGKLKLAKRIRLKSACTDELIRLRSFGERPLQNFGLPVGKPGTNRGFLSRETNAHRKNRKQQRAKAG